MLCPTISQIITIHTGNHYIAQLQISHRFRQVTWLIHIRWQRLAVPDIAERATARTDIAQNHKCGCATTKAFTNVRTSGFFANCVQLLVAQHFFDFAKAAGIITGFNADPVRLFQRFLRHDLDRNACCLQFAFLLYPGVSHGTSPVVFAIAEAVLRLLLKPIR